MHQKVIKIHKSDNVLVALVNLNKGESIHCDGERIELLDTIPAKHKVFTKSMKIGEKVIMYGVTVGTVQLDLSAGSLMTVSNTRHAADPYLYRNRKFQWTPPDVSKYRGRTFKGYRRSDGRYGTANYWLFIPTVFCENRNLDVIREALHNELGYSVTEQYKSFTRHLVNAYRSGKELDSREDFIDLGPSKSSRLFSNIDGIKFLNHAGGCGGTRQDAETLGRLLAAYCDHPNVAGITVLSLGCQNLQVSDMLQYLNERNPGFDKPLLIFEQQESKSEPELVREAIRKTFLHLIEANKTERQEAPLSALCIGVKCGGSDGFSGISANPAVGHCSDLLVALGGSVLLAEFPELCGAEQELIDRSVDEPTANKFISLMTDYSKLAQRAGSGFHMNPSPGNIKDGLITDAIKSAGACKKGGTSPVVNVLDYTEPATRPGLSLVCTPGNDVEATTGKAASGATLILFTTGLGTPTGNPVCPIIKISTNTKLARKMADIIDIDAGSIIEGEKSIEEVGEEILEYVIKAASGEVLPKAVLLNQDDFIPWKRGVSL
ncbi:altronate dehydratase family protein [Flavihumibacter sp. RY-1]|uniref:Altronate dehydratase family protein n=1 Tax=Flavihumibacter fluminis TaxID=2909236 RepID=A0ABS9BF06_9BACT|nr:altronate dehydratase family protein [Flavihumibacter fluminis]MCF1713718.1 altronate dehydratase family protein [Flavihumibacter fluminis]